MDQYLMSVIENVEIAQGIYRIVLKPKSVNKFSQNKEQYYPEPKPGQFMNIKVSDGIAPLLRRPISINNYEPETKQITMIYRTVGEGTKILSKYKIDEEVDVFGPLGSDFPYTQLSESSSVVLIGGGIGTPPLYYLAKELESKGHSVTTILGFQSKNDAILVPDFSSLGEVRVASMDGSIGTKGTVIDLIKEEDNWDVFYSCGPLGMLKAIQKRYIDSDIEGYLSLEERMGCGIGACYGCIVKVDEKIDKRGYKKVCEDGPVFSFREVIL